jgi:hypothetical protein
MSLLRLKMFKKSPKNLVWTKVGVFSGKVWLHFGHFSHGHEFGESHSVYILSSVGGE